MQRKSCGSALPTFAAIMQIPSQRPDAAAQPDELDRSLHAFWARFVGAMSPAARMLAWSDWAIHFATQPARAARSVVEALRPPPGAAHDPRLSDPAWDAWPFSVYRGLHETAAHGVRTLVEGVPGVDRHHAQLAAFLARQWLEMASPANSAFTHPQVLAQAAATGGMSLAKGALHWAEDAVRAASGLGPAQAGGRFVPGRDVALTPGKVILRNGLIELIQYAPATATVHAEPVLVVSAWIMKYYVLDLSAHDSLIRYLVQQGHTVFAVSWKNPGREDAGLGMDDYLRSGVMASLDAVRAVVPGRRVHAVGYCLGGTLMAIAAAAMARDGDDRLATLTLLAAQTDFSEPGELGLFIDESQLAFLEDVMARQGYLDAAQMAAAFRALRAGELVWAPMVRDYLLGERAPATALMAWNADGTRMPYRMHSDYLRGLFLDNALAAGRYRVGGRPVALGDIEVPVFALGTRTDHVAPWRSVHKIHLLCDAEITFVLTEGGHNAGILSEPGHPRRSHRVLTRAAHGAYVAPDDFLARTQAQDGSWWPCFAQWLAARSGPRCRPPPMGAARRGLAPLCDAPGRYVLGR